MVSKKIPFKNTTIKILNQFSIELLKEILY